MNALEKDHHPTASPSSYFPSLFRSKLWSNLIFLFNFFRCSQNTQFYLNSAPIFLLPLKLTVEAYEKMWKNVNILCDSLIYTIHIFYSQEFISPTDDTQRPTEYDIPGDAKSHYKIVLMNINLWTTKCFRSFTRKLLFLSKRTMRFTKASLHRLPLLTTQTLLLFLDSFS